MQFPEFYPITLLEHERYLRISDTNAHKLCNFAARKHFAYNSFLCSSTVQKITI